MSKFGALSLLSGYCGSSSEEDNVENDELNVSAVVKNIILREIIPKVVREDNSSHDIMVVDRQPTFDIYRGRKREFSESSSVIAQSESSESEIDTSSSDSDESAVEVLSEEEEEETKSTDKKNSNVPRVKGELLPSDLPPIEELHITVPENECFEVGTVSSCVDTLVVVQSLVGTPALDLDSVLFLDHGHKTLGKVFDVIGPVQNPFYCVRFNSADHIKKKEIAVGMKVFFAPRTEHTLFVFVEQLKKLKGSDASWRNDIEPPDNHVEYSDDEAERSARKAKKQNNKVLEVIANSISGKPSLPENEKRVYKPPSHRVQSQNSFYSSQNQNAFFRTNKRYRPRDFGPIHWNSMHTQHFTPPDFSRPPPPVASLSYTAVQTQPPMTYSAPPALSFPPVAPSMNPPTAGPSGYRYSTPPPNRQFHPQFPNAPPPPPSPYS